MKQKKVGKKTIYFDNTDGRHHFTDEQGNRIQSVTEFTGVLDKPALIQWAANMAVDYIQDRWGKPENNWPAIFVEARKAHRQIKRTAGDIGSAIHNIVSQWIKNKPFKIPDDEKIRNGFNAFLKFQKEHRAKWLESEKIVYSAKHNYVGILDALAIIDKKLTLVDFKSSNGIWPEMQLQVAGYQIALEEMSPLKIKQSMIIRFAKDTGEFETRIMSDPKTDQKAFLACVIIKRALNGKK